MSMTLDLLVHLKAANIADGRVYRDVRIQGAGLPAVRLQQITDTVAPFMKGEASLRETLVQADVFALSRDEADQVAKAVEAARPNRVTIGGTDFRRIFLDGGDTDSEIPATGETIYRTRIDLLVWHRPARQED